MWVLTLALVILAGCVLVVYSSAAPLEPSEQPQAVAALMAVDATPSEHENVGARDARAGWGHKHGRWGHKHKGGGGGSWGHKHGGGGGGMWGHKHGGGGGGSWGHKHG